MIDCRQDINLQESPDRKRKGAIPLPEIIPHLPFIYIVVVVAVVVDVVVVLHTHTHIYNYI